MVLICLFIPAVHNRLLSFHTFLLKEVKVVLDMLNWLHESQILSSIFPKYALVMFVIDLRKSFLFMQGYQNCWKFHTIHTMIYKIC